jgi:hypothetical protein
MTGAWSNMMLITDILEKATIQNEIRNHKHPTPHESSSLPGSRPEGFQ